MKKQNKLPKIPKTQPLDIFWKKTITLLKKMKTLLTFAIAINKNNLDNVPKGTKL